MSPPVITRVFSTTTHPEVAHAAQDMPNGLDGAIQAQKQALDRWAAAGAPSFVLQC